MKKERTPGTMSRRTFVKAAMTVAGSGVLVSCAPKISDSAPASNTEGAATTAAGKYSFEIAPDPIPDSQISETKEADVIVVGAGTSGLCAAMAALEEGAKVIVFAKGQGPVGRGGSNFAVYSKYMKELDIPKLEADPYLRMQIMVNQFNVDTTKWYKWYNNSEEAMDWLIDHMAKSDYELHLEQGNRGMDPEDPIYSPLGTHCWTSADMQRAGDGQPFVVETLAKQAAEAGAEIYYKMDAQQLVREDNNTGRVTAVIAKDADGKFIKFKGTKAIILATGDFSADKEMMEKYCPQGLPYAVNIDKDVDPENGKVYGGLFKGQGQKMGLWVGAAWQHAYPNAPMMGARLDGTALPYDLPNGCILNANGKRFFNEEITGGFMTNLQQQQPGNKICHIWDTAYAEAAKPWYLTKTAYGTEPASPADMIATWDASAEEGKLFKADTLAELIQKMELPESTLDEIEKYNGFCDSGEDTDFYKNAKFLRSIKEGPFYGSASTSITFLTVMGGLRTNINMQVCDANDQPIPGLYNVGTMIGDQFASCYTFQVPGHNLGMNCVTFGYLTGKYVAKNE
jgi:succinate dehydrogenase/fumarate reductase flavoprotein subunit